MTIYPEALPLRDSLSTGFLDFFEKSAKPYGNKIAVLLTAQETIKIKRFQGFHTQIECFKGDMRFRRSLEKL